MNENADRKPSVRRDVSHWEEMHQESAFRLIGEIARLRVELSEARTYAWAAEHRLYDRRWMPLAARSSAPGEPRQLPRWLATPVEPDRQDWWVPEPIYRTDLADFTGAGHGQLRLLRGARLEPGETILVGDGEEVLEADVLAVDEDVAQIRVHWDRRVAEPDAPQGPATD